MILETLLSLGVELITRRVEKSPERVSLRDDRSRARFDLRMAKKLRRQLTASASLPQSQARIMISMGFPQLEESDLDELFPNTAG